MNNLIVIKEQEVLGKEFKVYGTFENPLFLAKDVARWIEYNQDRNGNYNVSEMLETIDIDEKIKIYGTVDNAHSPIKSTLGATNRWFLTEDGLYEVLMQSRKPIAKEFKKEVKQILKEIRKTGSYQVQPQLPQTYSEALRQLANEVEQKEQVQKQLEQKTVQLDESKEWYTIKRVAQLNNVSWKSIDWKKLKNTSQAMELEVKRIFDANYGNVNAYNIEVWKHEYSEFNYTTEIN